jgi:WD40 repeat protein
VPSLAWSADGKVASGSGDGTIKIWNTNTGQCVSTLNVNSIVRTVTWSPDAKSLASGSDDQTVRIWGASLDK